MIQSMTGFGRAVAGRGIEKISVSIKCINGKILDLKIKGSSKIIGNRAFSKNE